MKAKRYPRTVAVRLAECEHEGDMAQYCAELRRAGAVVLSAELAANETCRIKLQLATAAIEARVQDTDAWSMA